MEMNEFYLAVKIFHQSRAAFNPITTVQILHPVDHLHLRPVDVTADDPLRILLARHRGQRAFVLGHELHRRLRLELQIRRQRPVTETQRPPQPVEVQIEIQDPVINVRTQFFEQMIEMRQPVRLMPVDHQVFFAICADMHHLARHRHTAETHADELLRKLIMIARDIDDLRLLAALAQQFLDQRVVIIPPKPAEPQLPAVDQIAHDIEILAIHHLQEIQQFLDATVTGAEVNVRNPDGSTNERVIVDIQIQMLLIISHTCRLI